MFDYFTEFGSLNHFKSGHITLLRTGIAYRLYADAPSVAIIQTRAGDVTVQKRPENDLEIMDSYMFFTH